MQEFPFDGNNPLGYTWPITRTPMQKTLVSTAVSGKEYRVWLQAWPRWKWKLDMGYLWDDYAASSVQGASFMFQTLAGFVNQMQGQYSNWIYFDPWDNAVVNQECLWNNGTRWTNTGNGTQTVWSFFKAQNGGPVEPVQWVQSPLGSSPNGIYVNGTRQSPGSYTINNGPPATVTFNTAPAFGATVEWTGQFYYLCRFTADSYDFSHDWYGKYSVKDLEFMSVLA
jgi:hypothetical protein